MGLTAEKLGAQYKLTKDEVDQFALRSQQLWKAGVYWIISVVRNCEGEYKLQLKMLVDSRKN